MTGFDARLRETRSIKHFALARGAKFCSRVRRWRLLGTETSGWVEEVAPSVSLQDGVQKQHSGVYGSGESAADTTSSNS